MAEQTMLVLSVDLKCSGCRKKIKKILSKIPQTGDPAYDVNANTVTINVASDSAEKIRDKLSSKSRVIRGIEIKQQSEEAAPPDEAEPVSEYPRRYNEQWFHSYDGYSYPSYNAPLPPPPPQDYYDPRQGCSVSKCEYCLNDENSNSCSIM